MAQIFTGPGLGLRGSSQAQLGSYGPKGIASLGQGGSSLYINAANGNVVLKQSDGFLADFGTSFDLSQTYNSRDKGAWRFNAETKLAFEGKLNTAGSIVTRTDEDGHKSRFIYDANQHAYLAVDGSTARITYDNTNWNYREGTGQTTFHYNSTGQLTSINDNDGHVLRFSYQNGQLITITDNNDKQTITWVYSQGLLRDVTFQSAGETVHHLHYDYDSHNRLSRVSRDLGNGKIYWIAYDYAGDSNLISDIRQSDGTSIHLDYDTEGRIKRLIDGEGHTTTYEYLAGKTIVTNGAGESWTYFYDAELRLTGIDGPENLHIRYHYNGQHLESITQGNQRWQFVYNEAGDCVRVESPTGEVVLRTYDSEHRLLSETRYQAFDDTHQPTKPVTSRYIYDEQGHLRFEITADGTVTEHRYDANGCRINSRCYLQGRWMSTETVTLSDMTIWSQSQSQQAISLVDYHYDFRGCLQEETHYTQINADGEGVLTADAIRTYSRYDAAGRLVEKSNVVNGELSTTHYVYDDLGRLIQTTDNQQHTQTFEYDDAHQRIIKTDANGLKTISIYDKNGLLLSTHQLDATHDYGTTTYQYDAAGRLITDTDVSGKTRHLFYDAQGRLQATVSITGQVTEYVYDLEGRCIQTHQYQQAINNQNLHSNGSNFAAIKPATTNQDRISQMVYNEHNQLAYQINAEGGVVAYKYDAQGRLIAKTAYATCLKNYQSSRQLTAMDMALIPNNDDRTVSYYYDAEGRLQAEVNGEGAATQYRYDVQGHLIETCRYANKVTSPYSGDWNVDAPVPLSTRDIKTHSLYNAAGLKIADIDAEGYLTEYVYDARGLLTDTIAYYTKFKSGFIFNEMTTLDIIRPNARANDHHTIYRYNDLNQLVEEKAHNSLVITYQYNEQGLIISKVSTDSKTHEARAQQYRYDALGRIVQSLDAIGAAKLAQNTALNLNDIEIIWQQHSVRYAYDIAGHLISKTNALNETSRYIYNDAGLLAYTISPAGSVTETRYNAFQQVETSIHYSAYYTGRNDTLFKQLQQHMETLADARFDEVTHYEYNSLGLLLSQRKGSGAAQITTYNAFGELSQRSQGTNLTKNIITDYQYDRRGLLRNRIQDVGGINKTLDVQYDVFGRVEKQWDGRQGVSIYVLNKRGEQIYFENQGHGIKKIQYDAYGRVLNIQDKTTIEYTYNDANNTFKLNKVGIGSTIETQFNAFGDKLSITDGNHQTTIYQYDAQGQLIRIDAPEHTFINYEYDAAGRLTFQEDAGGHVQRFTYDAEGHVLTKIIDPNGLAITTTYTYDAIGRQLHVIDAGRCTTFSYDNQGNLIQTRQDPDGLNLVTTFNYNDLGQLIRETRTNSQGADVVTAYTRDALGRCLTSTLDPDGLQLITTYTYDNADNVLSQTDANQHTTRYLYDANNRLRYRVDALGVVTEHRYDRNGNEVQTITYAHRVAPTLIYDEVALNANIQPDANADHHQFFTFDTQSRLTLSYDGLGYATQYTYDSNNNVTSKIAYAIPCSLNELKAGARPSPVANFQSRTTHFIYDGLNHQRFQIDPNGRVTESCYDLAGQLIQQTRFATLLSLAEIKQNYSITTIQSSIKIDPQHDESIHYAYDKAGRVTSQASAAGVITAYRYDAAGNQLESHQYATRLNTTQLADPDWTRFIQSSSDDRITRAIYDAAGRASHRISSSGQVVERQYDAVGNVIAEISHATGFTNDIHLTRYQYDTAGRLLNQTDAAQHTTRYQYDKNNNVISKTDANNAVWRYRFSDTNQLIETIAPATSFSTYTNGVWREETRSVITQNKYDSFGNISEIIKDVGGLNQTIQYTYDTNNRKFQTIYPNMAVNNAGKNTSRDRQESLQTLYETTYYNAFGEVIESRDRAGQSRHFAYDGIGRQIYSIDAEGGVTQYQYDAFDNVITKTSYATRLHINDYTTVGIGKALVDDTHDRHEYYLYDKDHHLTETRKDEINTYNARTREYNKLNPTTKLSYNAFGDLISRSVKLNDIDWAITTHKYSNDGLKTATLDAEHYLTTYAYNAYGLLESETQFAARTQDINVLPVTSSQDRCVSFVYNATGQLTQKTLKQVSYQRLTGNGSKYETVTGDLTSKYAYDAMGRLISTTDPEGHTAYSYYNAQGQLTTKIGVAMPTGRAATTYQYDALGKLIERHQWANGAQMADETQFTLNSASQADIIAHDIYDQSGQLMQKIDGTGHITHYSYDANGNVARSWQVLNSSNANSLIADKRYTYDHENHLTQTATIKSNGQWITDDAQYNAFGEVIKKGSNGKFATQVDYDKAGRVWRSNTQGYFQIYLYDLDDHVTQVITSTNAGLAYNRDDGVDLSKGYDDITDYNQAAARYNVQHQNNVYDALGHLIQQNQDARLSTRDVNDQVILPQVTQSNEVDRWGNLLRHTNANGHTTRYQYNAMDVLIQQDLPEVKAVDEHGVAHTLLPTIHYAVDSLGRTIAMTDANGHRAAHVFDAEGHITQDIDARGYHRDKKYNLLGQLTSQTNERGGTTSYTYDKENRLLSVTTAQTTQGYEYDGAGQVIRQTSNQAPAQTLEYDELGHITKQTTLHGSTTFEWDDEGNKIAEHDAKGNTATWAYDQFGRVREHTDLGGHRTSYTYNKNGLISTEKSTAGKDIQYFYYNDGQLQEYADIARSEKINYAYDAQGNVTSKMTSRVGDWKLESDHYQYDALERLEHVTRRSPDDYNPGIPTPDHRLLSIDYEYDAVGNIRDTHVTANYTGYQATSQTDYYRYDENNRMTLNKGQLINGEISITSAQGSAMEYDEAGNISLAQKYEGGALQNFSYHYNKDNLLERIRKNNHDLQTKRYVNGLLTEETLFDNEGIATQYNKMYYKDGQTEGQTIKNRFSQIISESSYKYDNVGNLERLITKTPTATMTHIYGYELWDSYQQKTDDLTQEMENAATSYGKSTHNYDVNSLLQEVIDSQPGVNNNTTSYYASNIDGVRAREDKTGQTSYLTVAGKTIGDLRLDNNHVQHLEVYGGFTPQGTAGKTVQDLLASNEQSKKETLHDFLRRTQTEVAMPDSSQDNLGAYTLKAGDTLESIAFQIYGDSSLWYLLADANGITDRTVKAGEQNSQLHIGQRINIPPSTKGQHHTSQTHKVLSNGYFTGDTSATAYSLVVQPPEPPAHTDKAWQIVASVMVAVTAAVVMVLSAGALGALVGATSSLGLITTGLAVLGGSSSLGMSATLAISFAAGFTSSIAGQGAANLLGQQKGIDFKGALLTGLGTAATAGASHLFAGANGALQNGLKNSPLNNYFNVTSAAEMMERDAVSQSLNLALTKHQHFDWLELGVSTATAGLMGGGKMQEWNAKVTNKIGTANTFINSELQALATGSITNSHFDATQILTDNLGNAVGSTLIQASAKQPEYSPIPNDDIEEGAFCPIPTEENSTPIPEGTYERFHQEAALRRRLEEASARSGVGGDGGLLNSGSVFGVIGDAVYGEGFALPIGQQGQGALASNFLDDLAKKSFVSRAEVWSGLNSEYKTRVDFLAVSEFEGGQILRGYLPMDEKGIVIGNSGITFATGFDVGQYNKKQIQSFKFPHELEDKLLSFVGAKKGDAKNLLSLAQQTVITKAEANLIDFSIKGYHLKSAINSWNSQKLDITPFFEDLTSAQQTVVFSRTFHQGVGMPNTSIAKKFYRSALSNNWNAAEHYLRNYNVTAPYYVNRVNSEADLLKLKRLK